MMAARKNAARKPAARKTAAKGTSTRTRTRKPRAPRKDAPAMKGGYRNAASAATALFTERALDAEDIGVTSVLTKEITGKYSGLTSTVKLDDGGKIVVSIKRTGPKG